MLRNATPHLSLRRIDSLALVASTILISVDQAEATDPARPDVLSRPVPIVQEQPFDYLGPSGGRTAALAQFDDLGGARTLVDVVLELLDSSTWLFHVQAHNNALVDNTVTIELRSDVRAVAPNLMTSIALSDERTATVGPLQTYDFGELTDQGSSSANLAAMPNPNFAPYIGQGTIDIVVSNIADLDVTCSLSDCNSTVSISHDQWRILGSLRLTYVYVDSPTSIDPQEIAPRGFALGTPRPNPWRGEAVSVLPLHLPQGAHVEIEMYDVMGRRIAHRTSTWLTAGDHLIPWVPPPLASGVYNVRLRTPAGITSTARWTILR